MPVFTQSDRAAWDRLDDLVRACDVQGASSLGKSDLRELGRLYRRVTADLARARTLDEDPELTAYLNDLAARAHARIYRTRYRGVERVWSFLGDEFPALFRRTLPYSSVAALLLLLPAIGAFGLVTARPEAAPALVPEAFLRALERRGEEDMGGRGLPAQLSPVFSSAIMVNNIQVGFLAFGLGITAGLGTAYVLIRNGLLLGAVAGVASGQGSALGFWALILPHGIIELTAIFIAGGAGLRLGRAVINPGEHSRRDAIVVAARGAGPRAPGGGPR
ncbi:MAG: stage II sporulation protein M, partial [Armatimonadota bacterium]